MVREIDHRAGKPDVPVHLRCTIVLPCRLLAGADEVRKVGFGIEREKSSKRRGGKTDNVLLKGGEDRGVGSYCWLGVPGTVVGNPGRDHWNICICVRY